ncbi:MAG: MarR family transcriptional regulator [Pseudomonadota bacterium]
MHEVKLSSQALQAAAGGCHAFAARRRARLISQRYDTALAAHGLTIGQFSMLAALAGAGRMTVSQLSQLMGLEQSATSRGLMPLVRDGLVFSRPARRDGRVRVVSLTKGGTLRLNAASIDWAEVQDALTREIAKDAALP